MNSHLIRIPSLAPLTARRLPCRYLQALGRQADGALNAEVLGLGALDELLADFFERGHFFARQGDTDLVDGLTENEEEGFN